MHKLLLDLPTRLETPRLIVRAFEPGDGPVYLAAGMRNRAHLAHFEAGNPLNSLHTEDEAEVIVRQMALEFAARERFRWGAFERETGAWVGQIYVGVTGWEMPEFEIGYVADVDHEGRGYITEAGRAVIAWAFGPLGARRLRLECDATNARSIRVAERCGFTLEGRVRQNHLWPDGSLTDTLLYGLLRDDQARTQNRFPASREKPGFWRTRMMTEYPIIELAGLRALFPGPQLEMTLASILEGNTRARLWLDDGLALLWDQGNNVFYLALTDASGPRDMAHLSAHIAGPVRAAALEGGRPYFRARGVTPGADAALQHVFAPIALHPVRKRFYRFSASSPEPQPDPDGVAFLPIDGVLFRMVGVVNLEDVRREIGYMWPSVSHFYTRGFGYAALVDRTLVCWSTAEYVSERACGIGIETIDAWQNQGIATAAALRLVRHALARGITPHWECDAENLPSVRVAEKVGFTLLEETTFWAGLFT